LITEQSIQAQAAAMAANPMFQMMMAFMGNSMMGGFANNPVAAPPNPFMGHNFLPGPSSMAAPPSSQPEGQQPNENNPSGASASSPPARKKKDKKKRK
jgi:hypothetical protein